MASNLARATKIAHATNVAKTVTDPEMPMLTLSDLGVLRDVGMEAGGRIVVSITPTYSGCPAMATMRTDLLRRLHDAGFGDVDVRTVLEPAWTSDWITASGRRKLIRNGLSAPGPAPLDEGPVPLTLRAPRREIRCPQCGSDDTALSSEFGATACRALYRCVGCGEPFEHVKEI